MQCGKAGMYGGKNEGRTLDESCLSCVIYTSPCPYIVLLCRGFGSRVYFTYTFLNFPSAYFTTFMPFWRAFCFTPEML